MLRLPDYLNELGLMMIEKQDDVRKLEAITTHTDFVPKFCTGILMQLLENQNLVMSLMYTESSGGPSALIERIAIDLKHAKSLRDALDKIVKEVENNASTSS